jgi:hypothetical protein
MSTASEIRFENAWQLTTLERMVVALVVVAILELAFNRALDESEHRISPLGDPLRERRVSGWLSPKVRFMV